MNEAVNGARALILGGGGMLAYELAPALARSGWMVDLVGHDACDITDRAAIEARVTAAHPDLVINCAAYTHVDQAERESERAFAVNADGAGHVACAARAAGAVLLHVSTNAVFDGSLGRPYRESDPVSPLGVYGRSKYVGEQQVVSSGVRAYIVRTGHLYGGRGRHFFAKVLARIREGKSLRVVDDQIVAPTWTRDLAAQLAQLVEKAKPGLYHAMALGEVSWYRATCEALLGLGVDAVVQAVSSKEYDAPAPRACYGVLANEGLDRVNACCMRPWDVALAEWLTETYGHDEL